MNNGQCQTFKYFPFKRGMTSVEDTICLGYYSLTLMELCNTNSFHRHKLQRTKQRTSIDASINGIIVGLVSDSKRTALNGKCKQNNSD